MGKPLRGILSALSTPFDAQSRVDEGALRELVEGQIAEGIHGFIPCGSTGEFPALSTEERKRVTEVVLETVNGRAPVAAHTGSTSTAVAIDLSKHAKAAGADAVMVVQPYYEPLTLDEIYGYFQEIGAAADLPIMVYNIPSCTGMNLPVDFMARMAREIPQVQYVKDSSGDLSQVEQMLYQHSDVMTSFNGWDTVTFSGLSLGAKGSVWGAANCMPKQCADLFNLTEAGRLQEARELWEKMYPVQQFLVTEGYIASVKAGANLIGFRVGEPRRPFRALSPQKVEEMRGLLEAAGALRTPVHA
jgi:4-hydroxy-tetrahydrodipicolinate synthase